MRLLTTTCCLVLLHLVLLPVPRARAADGPAPSLVVAGHSLELSPAPRLVDGRLVAPVVPLAEALGATVTTAGGAVTLRTVTGTTVVLRPDGAEATVEGRPEKLSAATSLIGNRLCAPAADVLRLLGMHAVWDDGAKRLSALPALQSVTVHAGPEGAWLDITTGGPCTPKLKVLPAPHRVVVDLPGVRWSEAPQAILANSGRLQRVRWSQYQADPPVARIVADLSDTWPSALESPERWQHRLNLGAPTGAEPVADRRLAELKAVESEAREPGQVKVRLRLSDPITPRYTVLRRPLRVVLTLPTTRFAGGRSEIRLGGEFVERVKIGPAAGGEAVLVTLVLTEAVRFAVAPGGSPADLEVTFQRGRLAEETVMLDPGHGGADSGAHGQRLLEKAVNLDVAQRTRKLLQAGGATVSLSRDQDVFFGLYDRPRLANTERVDVFLSIHCNASRRANTGFGTECYYFTDQSACLANLLQESLVEALGRKDRGVFRERFVVVRETQMPAALCELAFIDEDREEALLASENFRDQAARGVYRALKAFVEGSGALRDGELAP